MPKVQIMVHEGCVHLPRIDQSITNGFRGELDRPECVARARFYGKTDYPQSQPSLDKVPASNSTDPM